LSRGLLLLTSNKEWVVLSMKLTVGMPSFNNFTEVFYTIQSLRMYHDLTDTEILVVDNFGDPELERFVKSQGAGIVRYEKYLNSTGPAGAKNAVIELAKGEMVLCIDSHVILAPGALKNIPVSDNLVSGPLLYNNLKDYVCCFKDQWRGQMWGIWGDYSQKVPTEPFEIWGMGMGCFLVKKSSWLGFNPKFKGFGGEEGYIHEKYRKAGRKVICLPSLIWLHQFDRKIPYPLQLIDRVINYIIGFRELGLDLKPIEDLFKKDMFDKAVIEADKR
jgi:glycosyltransferase involved in cell wall biosynthesis